MGLGSFKHVTLMTNRFFLLGLRGPGGTWTLWHRIIFEVVKWLNSYPYFLTHVIEQYILYEWTDWFELHVWPSGAPSSSSFTLDGCFSMCVLWLSFLPSFLPHLVKHIKAGTNVHIHAHEHTQHHRLLCILYLLKWHYSKYATLFLWWQTMNILPGQYVLVKLFLIGCIIFHGLDVPQLIKPFSHQWTFRLFPTNIKKSRDYAKIWHVWRRWASVPSWHQSAGADYWLSSLKGHVFSILSQSSPIPSTLLPTHFI